MNIDRELKLIDVLVNTIMVLGVVVLLLVMYGTYEDYNRKLQFDAACSDAGGIPLKYTYHYDRKQNRIEFTCLSVNAVLDVE